MAAVDIAHADAIVYEINNHAFDMPAEATRSYADFKATLETLGQLRIDVVPWNYTVEVWDRGAFKYVTETDILIRMRLAVTDLVSASGSFANDKLDDLALLREQIHEFFMPCQASSQNGRQLSQVTAATWEETKLLRSFDRRMLSDSQQFTAWIRLAYSETKAATP